MQNKYETIWKQTRIKYKTNAKQILNKYDDVGVKEKIGEKARVGPRHSSLTDW